MNIKFAIVLDTRNKPNKDGQFPLSLRTTFGKNVRQLNLKSYYTERQYQIIFKGSPTPETKRFRDTADEIIQKAYEIKKTLTKFEYNEFRDLMSGKKKFINPNSKYLRELFDFVIETKKREGAVKTAESYQSAINSLEKFKPDLTISDITPQFLKDYEDWNLKKTNSKVTATTGIYLRNLRAIINLEKNKNRLPENYFYPFGRYDYTIEVVKRPKKALSFSELESIIKFNDFDDENQRWARDLWLLQFYCNGINLKDLLLLKWENKQGDFFYLKREKTKRSTKGTGTYIKIPIIQPLNELLEKLGDKNSPYVLGFLREGMNAKQIENVKGRIGKKINTQIKHLKDKLNLSIDILSKSTRDAYATCLKRSGVEIAVIAEMLGHTSTKITQHYLDSFEDEHLHKINSVLPQ